MKPENIKLLKRGMKIKISETPRLSIQKHGSLNGYKQTLAGTIQTFKRVDSYDLERIYIEDCSRTSVSFNCVDVEIITEPFEDNYNKHQINKKPQLFDIEKLMN
ncbi:MAG: hypothetical protein ACFFG0_00750 [Candidatus Thorarchaeota archaeon]